MENDIFYYRQRVTEADTILDDLYKTGERKISDLIEKMKNTGI